MNYAKHLRRRVGLCVGTLLMGQFAHAATGDAGAARLRAYVTNFEGEKISVIDLADQKETAQITRGRKPHGVAIAADGSEVFVTNEGDDTLSLIDPAANRVTQTIKVGSHPQQLAVSQDGTTFYVPLNGDNAVPSSISSDGKSCLRSPLGETLISPSPARLRSGSSSPAKAMRNWSWWMRKRTGS